MKIIKNLIVFLLFLYFTSFPKSVFAQLSCDDQISGRILDKDNQALSNRKIILSKEGKEVTSTYGYSTDGGFIFFRKNGSEELWPTGRGNFVIKVVPGKEGEEGKEYSFPIEKCTAKTYVIQEALPEEVIVHNVGATEQPQVSPIKPKTCVVGSFTGSDAVISKAYTGIDTAIGCIPTDPQEFISVFFKWAIGLAGGIAFILMLFAAFKILMSTGNPEALKAAQEQLTSAIIGLLFIIFSVFLLRIIGLPIMNISSLPLP